MSNSKIVVETDRWLHERSAPSTAVKPDHSITQRCEFTHGFGTLLFAASNDFAAGNATLT